MLTQEQIERIPSHERYWKVSDMEAQAQARRELSGLALTPSQMLPFFSISDYEAARRGESVPIEQPKPIPIIELTNIGGFWRSVDDRSMSEYLRDGESIRPPSPLARPLGEVSLISDYMARVDDTIPMYLRAVGDVQHW